MSLNPSNLSDVLAPLNAPDWLPLNAPDWPTLNAHDWPTLNVLDSLTPNALEWPTVSTRHLSLMPCAVSVLAFLVLKQSIVRRLITKVSKCTGNYKIKDDLVK